MQCAIQWSVSHTIPLLKPVMQTHLPPPIKQSHLTPLLVCVSHHSSPSTKPHHLPPSFHSACIANHARTCHFPHPIQHPQKPLLIHAHTVAIMDHSLLSAIHHTVKVCRSRCSFMFCHWMVFQFSKPMQHTPKKKT